MMNRLIHLVIEQSSELSDDPNRSPWIDFDINNAADNPFRAIRKVDWAIHCIGLSVIASGCGPEGDKGVALFFNHWTPRF